MCLEPENPAFIVRLSLEDCKALDLQAMALGLPAAEYAAGMLHRLVSDEDFSPPLPQEHPKGGHHHGQQATD